MWDYQLALKVDHHPVVVRTILVQENLTKPGKPSNSLRGSKNMWDYQLALKVDHHPVVVRTISCKKILLNRESSCLWSSTHTSFSFPGNKEQRNYLGQFLFLLMQTHVHGTWRSQIRYTTVPSRLVAVAASLAAEAPPKDHFDWTILGSQAPWIPLTSPTRMFPSQLFRYRIRAGGMANGAPAAGGMSNGAPRASGVPASVCCFTLSICFPMCLYRYSFLVFMQTNLYHTCYSWWSPNKWEIVSSCSYYFASVSLF
jgi:hypothetical protein